MLKFFKELIYGESRQLPKNQACRCVKCEKLFIVDGYVKGRGHIVCDGCRNEAEAFNDYVRGRNAAMELELTFKRKLAGFE